jgi:hypothetical protein
MNNRVKSRSIIYGVIGIFCLAALMISGRPLAGKQKGEGATAQDSAKPNLLVLVKPQSTPPLLINGMTVDDSADPRMPTVQFTVTNNTRKRIMAYAIRHDATLPHSSFSGTVAVNSPDRNRAIPAGAQGQLEITGIQYSEPPISLTLSVDFVEFVGGTRWGPDTYKHGELIDGLRVGAKMAKEAMLRALEAYGPEVFIHSLDSIQVKADQPDLHSSNWLEGFRHGVGWMRERVRSKGKDLIEIKRELRHSSD